MRELDDGVGRLNQPADASVRELGREHRNDLKGIAMAVAGAAAFGTLAIFAKYAYREGADPIPLLAGRFAVAALLLGIFCRLSGRRIMAGRRAIVRLLLLGGLGYAVESTLFFEALDRAPAGVVELVFYSYPLWTALLAIATGLEEFRWRLLVALSLGSMGVIVIFSLPQHSYAGLYFALAAAIAVAFYYLGAQVVSREVRPHAAAFWTAVGASGTLTAISVVTGTGLPAGALGPMGGLGLATALAFLAMYGAIVRIGSARTAIANMFEPVTTIILAAIFLEESISGRVLLGAALVLSTLPVLASKSPR